MADVEWWFGQRGTRVAVFQDEEGHAPIRAAEVFQLPGYRSGAHRLYYRRNASYALDVITDAGIVLRPATDAEVEQWTAAAEQARELRGLSRKKIREAFADG